MTETLSADDLVSLHLRQMNKMLSDQLKSDVLFLRSPMYMGVDDRVRNVVESLCEGQSRKKAKLTVLLETSGGLVDVVERINNVFRNHYKEIDYIVPSYAYSAGTVLVLSGDNIYMDYYSVLGPIDPQIKNENGEYVPGMGYLHMYAELVEKSKNNDITAAELVFLAKKFEPAEMFLIRQAMNHSEELIIDWLPKYKFKTWKKTESKGTKVTAAMKKERAESIAKVLGNAEKWHSHGRGITMTELTGRHIKLKIENFGADKELNRSIRHYYDLFIDFGIRTGSQYAIHSQMGMRRIGN